MRFAVERGERLVEFVESGSGQADRFAGVVDEIDLVDPQGGDDDDRTIVVLRTGAGAAGQAGVGRLRNDDEVIVDAICSARHMSTRLPGRSTASTLPPPKRRPWRPMRSLARR